MKILFNDLVQNSDANSKIKSPALSDRIDDNAFVIELDESGTIDCIGVGNTDATTITVNGETVTLEGSGVYKNGLYLLDTTITGTTLTISHNGNYIGRFGAGGFSELGNSPAREPGYKSTATPRRTLSGQIVPGAGGVTTRSLQVEVKYKVTREIMTEIQTAYPEQIGQGFPLFILFDKEYKSGAGRMPWARLYATGDKDIIFQSSVNKFLYSNKWPFQEAF